MQQVCFCGSHSDVCGSYEKDALANITLKWMAEHGAAVGLRFDDDTILSLPSDSNEFLHDSFTELGARLFKRKVRTLDDV